MSSTSDSNFARVSFRFRCFGPEASAVMNGSVISVSWTVDSSHLGLLRSFLQPLQRHLVFGKIDALILLELVNDPVDDPLIDVVATQMRVAIGRLDFDNAFADFEDRDIERTAAEVVDGDGFVLLLVQTVRQRRSRRLIDDSQDFQTGNAAGVLRRLPLRVIEVGRNRDDGLVDLLAQIVFGGRSSASEESLRRFPAANIPCR